MRVVVETSEMPKEVADVIEALRKENTKLKGENSRLKGQMTSLRQEWAKYEDATSRIIELGSYFHTMNIGDHWDMPEDDL